MSKIQMRRGTAATWTSAGTVLASGEMGVETDTGKVKVGDGVTAWASLLYITNTNAYTPGGTDVAVTDGGTGVGTLTGIVKGNGTSPFTAASAGTDYVAPSGALGTPSSGTLTNCSGLPLSGITASTATALGVGSLELGNASDTTISRSAAGVLAVEGVVVPTISSTNTITNKRITPRISTTASSATPTINTDNVDVFGLTAQAVDITSMTSNLSGTPSNGDKLTVYIIGTATRAITWGASFEDGIVPLPTATVGTSRLDVVLIWNASSNKWHCMQSALPSVTATIVAGGSMGATPALNVGNKAETFYTGTLTASATLTISNVPAGGKVALLLTQDATGGRTLNITGITGAIPIDTTTTASSAVLVFSPDGSTLWVTGQQGPAGASGTSAGTWAPADYGWKAWSWDPSQEQNVQAPGAGQLFLIALKIAANTTITNVILYVHTAGATLTSGQNFAALYQGGNLLAATADQSGNWNSSGAKVMALTTPQAVTAGVVYVAFFTNGTTQPGFSRASGVNTGNIGLSAPNFRVATANTGLTTTMPSTYGTQSASTISFFAAVS